MTRVTPESSVTGMTSETAPASTPAPAPVICDHCGLPAIIDLTDAAGVKRFCCAGCRAAYQVISSCGLAGYYKLLETSGDHAPRADQPGQQRGHTFAEFDDPVFASRYTRVRPDGLHEVEFMLDNVHCGACLWLIEKLPSVVPGVVEARLHIRGGLVTIAFSPGLVRLSRIASALATLGYTPHPARERSTRDLRAREDRQQLIRIAIAGACAGNVMMLAFALYGGYFDGMTAGYQWLFRGLSAVLGVLCLAWPGGQFFRSAWAAIRARAFNIDVPIVLALLAGGAAGLVNTILGRGELYFDSLTMLVLLLLFGRFVGHKRQRWATDAVELLYSITPFSARRVSPGGDVTEVPAEALNPGDIVEVRAGESIPVDGVITDGRTALDISLLTGESRPAHAELGAEVHAGAVNLGSPVRVQAAATGRETRAGRLMRMVGEAAARRAGIIRFTDAIASRFIIVVLLAAAVTFAWWIPQSPVAALDHAIALLIVTCPCVLGIAAPIAVALAIGQASRDRILIKGSDALETLAATSRETPGVVVLDKTGTLTEGKPRVVRVWGSESAVNLAAAVEHGVAHPLAEAIRLAAPQPLPSARDITSVLGRGVRGYVKTSAGDAEVFVGSEFASREHATRFAVDPAAFEFARHQGLSAVGVVVDHALVAVLGIGDRLRGDASDSLSRLQALGWSVEILSGDDASAVRRVGRELGLPPDACHGNISPENKLAFIRARRAEHRTVVMVGDGVNDAAALAAASVGIAVHGGAEASLAAADIYIGRPGLAPIVQLAVAGPRMLRTIRRMLIVSAAYNVLAGALAMTGLIHPMIAAILMPVSSLTVLAVAIRSRSWPNVSSGPALREARDPAGAPRDPASGRASRGSFATLQATTGGSPCP